MRFAHLGDLHIGKSLNEFDLSEDQSYILKQVIGIAKEKQVDALLIAGDIYDKAIPSEAAVRLFNDFLVDAKQNNLKVLIISGNHDSDERLNFGSDFFKANGIYIASKYNGEITKVAFQDEYGEINVYLMPYVKASQVKRFYPEEPIENYDQAIRVALQNSDINPEERNVLVAHQFVVGSKGDPEHSGSEQTMPKYVGDVERIGYGCFDAFDYTALGHIHSPQAIGRPEIRYSGSLLKYSKDEIDSEKSVPIVTVGTKGQTEIELVPLKPLRELRQLKGTFENITKQVENPQDFIYVTLTDPVRIDNALGKLSRFYPNTVQILFDDEESKKREQIDISETMKSQSFEEIIAAFYKSVFNEEISEEESNILKQLADEE